MQLEPEHEALVTRISEELRTLLNEVREERIRLHKERQAIYKIVIAEGHMPTLHRLADLLEENDREVHRA